MLATGSYTDTLFSSDGTKLYAIVGSGVTVFDVASGATLASYTVGTSLGAADLSPDGNSLLLADRQTSGGVATFYELNLVSGNVTTFSDTSGSIVGFSDLSFLTGTTALVAPRISTNFDVTLRYYDLTTGTYTSAGTARSPTMVATPDHSKVLVGLGDIQGTEAVYQSDGTRVATLVNVPDPYAGASVPSVPTGGISISRDGSLTAFGEWFATGNLQPLSSPFASAPYIGNGATAFSPDGHTLYDAHDSVLFVVDIASGTTTGVYTLANPTVGVGNSFGDVVSASGNGRYVSVLETTGIELIDLSQATYASGPGNDTLSGSGTLYGLGGNDSLTGSGYANLYGGLGDDSYFVTGPNVRVYELAGQGNDTVYSSITYQLGSNVENLTLTGTAAIDGYGNELVNVITGNSQANTLVGLAGADTLIGGDGDDLISSDVDSRLNYYNAGQTSVSLDQGSDHDVIDAGAGNDTISAGYGDDVDGGTGEDKLLISLLGATSGVTADFSQPVVSIGGGFIQNVENLSYVGGSNFDDTVNVARGDGLGDLTRVYGLGGNDHIVAGDYTGLIDGGDGDDVIDAYVGAHLSTITGGAGNDTITGPSNGSSVVITGDAGNDTIFAAGATVHGGFGDDQITFTQSTHTEFATGDAGNDQLQAGSSGSLLSGGAGADTLTGDAGGDVLVSGDFKSGVTGLNFTYGSTNAQPDMGLEHDRLSGNGGDDFIAAGYGDDVDGGTGTDTLELSLGGTSVGVTIDTAQLASGAPVTIGGGTIQNIERLSYLRGSEFSDTLSIATQSTPITVDGGAGDDVIITHGSSVHALGGYGNDTFVSGTAADTFDGEAGVNTLDYSSYLQGITVNGLTGSGSDGDTFQNVQNFIGTAFDDRITGDYADNTITGGDGNDTLDGSLGSDTLYGGRGDDTYYLDSYRDSVIENAGEGYDTVYSTDFLELSDNVEKGVLAGTGDFSVIGNVGDNWLVGNSGANLLYGDDGNDRLDGGAGADQLYGGAGNDTFAVDNVGDRVFENANEGTDTVESSISYTLGANVENLTLTGSADLSGTGNALANLITGNNGNNSLVGGGGADTLIGGAGDDIYTVSDSATVIVETVGNGNDTIKSSVSYVLGAGVDVETSRLIGASNINLTGNADHQILIGNSGNNVIDGGGGGDRMKGAAGDDTYIVRSAADTIVEVTGEGDDTVKAAVSYTLGAGAQVEHLYTLDALATTAIDLTGNDYSHDIQGNAGVNVLTGGTGNDTLTGNGGADTLVGGAGDDIYVVTDASTAIVEATGGGNDTIKAFVSYVLGAGVDVETTRLIGSANLDLAGNADHQILIGNLGNNTIDGGGGGDRMKGAAGDDTYIVRSAADVIVEIAGDGNDTVKAAVSYTLGTAAQIEHLWTLDASATTAINLTGNDYSHDIQGNAAANVLTAGSGDDVLQGFAGNDTLFGGGGADRFVFDHGTGQDSVGDFVSGSDRLDLSAFGFASFSDVQAATHDVGGNAVIDLGGGDSVTLSGFLSAQLQSGDVILSGGGGQAPLKIGVAGGQGWVVVEGTGYTPNDIAVAHDVLHGVGQSVLPAYEYM